MTDQEFSQLIIVMAHHGEKYMGFIPREDPAAYVESMISKDLPVEVSNARALITQAQASQARDGTVQGIRTFMALLPIDMFSGPVKKFYVAPSAWYFPSDSPETRKKIEDLFEAAKNNEIANRAQDAGLKVPGRN